MNDRCSCLELLHHCVCAGELPCPGEDCEGCDVL